MPPLSKNNNFAFDDIIGNVSYSSISSITERKARFALNLEENVVLIESHKEYSSKELQQYYWTPDEQEDMRDELMNTIERMIKGKKPKKHDYRGLESYKDQEAYDRIRTKHFAAVFAEQAMQSRSSVKNAESMANVSKMVSADSAKIARKTARKDAQDAEDAWNVELQNRRESLPRRMFSKLIRSNSRRIWREICLES